MPTNDELFESDVETFCEIWRGEGSYEMQMEGLIRIAANMAALIKYPESAWQQLASKSYQNSRKAFEAVEMIQANPCVDTSAPDGAPKEF